MGSFLEKLKFWKKKKPAATGERGYGYRPPSPARAALERQPLESIRGRHHHVVDDSIANPMHPLSPLNPVHSLYDSHSSPCSHSSSDYSSNYSSGCDSSSSSSDSSSSSSSD